MFKVGVAVANFPIGCFIQTADGAEKTTGVPTGTFVADGTPGVITGSASYDAVGKCWVWSSVQAAAMNGAIVGLVFNLAGCMPIVFVIRTSTKLVSDLQDPTVAAIQSGLATATALATAQADLDNPGQYKADVSGLATSAALTAVSGLVDDLETRLTATRAGYLDNLSAGAVATTAALTAVATNITTLLARIGAFTGTGVNTILGFLKAMASKIATLPSDIGGTFDPATDSLEALHDRMTDVVTVSDSGTNYSRKRGDTWIIPFSNVGVITGYTKLWFTVKRRTSDLDADAILFIEKVGGLTVVNGAAYTTIADGAIAVTSDVTGTGTITVKPAVTKLIEPRDDLDYDLQALVGAVVTTLQSGILMVTGDVTRAVS